MATPSHWQPYSENPKGIPQGSPGFSNPGYRKQGLKRTLKGFRTPFLLRRLACYATPLGLSVFSGYYSQGSRTLGCPAKPRWGFSLLRYRGTSVR